MKWNFIKTIVFGLIRVFIMERIDIDSIWSTGYWVSELHLGFPQNITLYSLKNFENHIFWWYDILLKWQKIVIINTYFSKRHTKFIKKSNLRFGFPIIISVPQIYMVCNYIYKIFSEWFNNNPNNIWELRESRNYIEFWANIFIMASLLLYSFKCCNLTKNLKKAKEYDNKIKIGLHIHVLKDYCEYRVISSNLLNKIG